jgi:hypothetical protein
MAIPTALESLSTTAASNGPAGSEQRTLADDGLRQAYAFLAQITQQGTDIASGATITPASTGWQYDVTGVTGISAIATTNSWTGRLLCLQFDGILTITHSSNLALPGSANITTAAGDVALFLERGASAWRCIHYQRADGTFPTTAYLTTSAAASTYLALSGGTITGNITLGNDGADVVTTNGNVTINAPSSGDAVTLTSVAGGFGIKINDASGQGATFRNATNTSGFDIGLLAGTGSAEGYLLNRANSNLNIGTNGSVRFIVTNDGRLYGTALHNNAGAVTGTTNQYIASGTYTPTLTNTTNVASSSHTNTPPAKWTRLGNVVTVSGAVTIQATAASGAQTVLDMSLPIASNIAIFEDLAGTSSDGGGVGAANQNSSGFVQGSVANDRAQLVFRANNTSSQNWYYVFSYTVL